MFCCSTFLAPVAIGLALFVGHLASVGWTGGGINPARTLGPSVANRHFVSNTWIYYVGQIVGSILATTFYILLKFLDYEKVVAQIDSANHDLSQKVNNAPMIVAFNHVAKAIPGVHRKMETADIEKGNVKQSGGGDFDNYV